MIHSQKCDFGFTENSSISPEASVATAYQLTASAVTSVKKMYISLKTFYFVLNKKLFRT